MYRVAKRLDTSSDIKAGRSNEVWGVGSQKQTEDSGIAPLPLLELPQEDQPTQSLHMCRALRSGPCWLPDCQFSFYHSTLKHYSVFTLTECQIKTFSVSFNVYCICWYGVTVLQNPQIWNGNVIPDVATLRKLAFQSWWSHEFSALMNRIMLFVPECIIYSKSTVIKQVFSAIFLSTALHLKDPLLLLYESHLPWHLQKCDTLTRSRESLNDSLILGSPVLFVSLVTNPFLLS